jgi:hypothetical protein
MRDELVREGPQICGACRRGPDSALVDCGNLEDVTIVGDAVTTYLCRVCMSEGREVPAEARRGEIRGLVVRRSRE